MLALKKSYIVLLAFLILSTGCESTQWNKAGEKNTIEAYETFLEKYPDGNHANEARGKMALLAFQKARDEGSVEAYENFMKQYPAAKNFHQICIQKIETLVDLQVKNLSPEKIKNKLAVIETEFGDITFEFFPDVAPNHCRNIIKLARIHFYDNLSFHQIMTDSLVRGGAPKGDPRGGPGYTISAEFNDRPHIKGTVGMFRHEHPNSAGSQFYICLKRIPELDGNYTVFGQVIEGTDVLDAIASTPASGPPMHRPLQRITIRRLYIRDR